MSAFVELNGFSLSEQGFYHAPNDTRQFNYSDGEQTEARLHDILTAAQDRSSHSPELEAQIVDWPTEYHLSSTRANLLRGLDLSGVNRVLELGCGCGSITRYLGELDGVTVDSVEGSPARASLAALRCQDLPNVTISVANFNDVDFPQHYYDLVLFVGVTEYAGRFSDKESDEEALQELLLMGKKAAKHTGATLIAIENRTGLKYALGACEDHYAEPYVGIDNYQQSIGIRTFTKSEWQQHIEQTGFTAQQFIYPFPDYKVPTLLINDDCLPQQHNKEELNQALKLVKSRDYNRPFNGFVNEYRAWQSTLEAQVLGELANSFLILIGNDICTIKRLSDFSIEAYPIPQLDYWMSPEAVQNSESIEDIKRDKAAGDKQIDRLNADLQQLQRHADSLQEKVELMANSQSWKWLSSLRRLMSGKR